MANRKGITKKKPSIEKFAEVTEACRGVISKIADGLNVDRTTIYDWCNADARFQAVIDNYKGKLVKDQSAGRSQGRGERNA